MNFPTLGRFTIPDEARRPQPEDLFQLSPLGHLRLDEDGTILDINPQGELLLGQGRATLLGQLLTPFIEEADHAAFYRHLHRVLHGQGGLKGGQQGQAALRMLRTDGTLFNAHLESVRLPADLAARPPSRPIVLCAILDATARFAAEADLRASERRYRALFEMSRDGIFLFDGVGRVIDANQAGLELLGAEDFGEVHGRLRSSLYPAAEREAAEAAFMRHLYAPRPLPLELNLQQGDGAAVPVEVSAALMPTTEAALTQVHFRDIRERRRAERERQHLEERLRQSQKLEAIGRLAGGVAHDMNNVLGVIMGLASLLLSETGEDDPRHRSMSEILLASRRGRDLTQNLLRFARKDDSRREPLSLSALAGEVAEVLHRTLPKSIAIELQLAQELPQVVGDATQLHQALLNLCLNAVDAMPEGGVLSLQTGHRAGTPPCVELSIADTGVGMDPQTLSRSLEPFFTTKQVGKGTGLGLTMVYGTVRAHGGDVDIESTPGRGTRVTLWLPVAEHALVAPEPEPEPAQAQRREREAPTDAAQGQTVLLVDDEPMVRNAERRLLQRLGYSVLTAESGAECLRIYKERKDAVWLVILDLSMPQMDGAQVLRHLQELDPGARVLVCSGYNRDVSPEELMHAGALGYLRKPFEMQELASKLRQVERMA